MGKFYGCYRVGSGTSSDNQYEVISASSQSKAKELIQKRYPGCKINWIHTPSGGCKPPTWFKG